MVPSFNFQYQLSLFGYLADTPFLWVGAKFEVMRRKKIEDIKCKIISVNGRKNLIVDLMRIHVSRMATRGRDITGQLLPCCLMGSSKMKWFWQ